MSTTRTVPRTTSISKHQTNGSGASFDMNDTSSNTNYTTGNNPEFDPSLQRPALTRNVSQYDGVYRNARFIHAISSELVGQQVVIQTSEHERFHGVLETLSPNADIVLTVSHRLDNNNNDIIASPTSPIDLIDTIDSSSQTFELHKRIIKASNIVEIIAVDIDLAGSAKCSLDDTPKVSQLEDDRFSRMEHFYGTDEIDPETLEDLDLGDDGKAGFDPDDMFHTNREKFNTTTDFDEKKYSNVPIPQISTIQQVEIEKKVKEIERGIRTEEIDEDDAGVKRPPESHNINDGNSNLKNNRSYRTDSRYDAEYNPSKRGQRPGGNTNNRRGGHNPKQNQYNSSQATNNRQQQYNTRGSRNNRFVDNRSPHEGRDSSLQTTNEESTRNQRLNSGNFSQGQASDPTSPSTTVPARTVYSSNNRSSTNRNSPPSGTNKVAKKPLLNEQQSTNEESDQRSSLNRPSQLQAKQQQSPSSNNNNIIPPPLTLPTQDENSSSHDVMNTNQADYTHTPGTTTPNSIKSNAGLNPDADEFVPVFSNESNSRPESRGASSASSASMNTFIPQANPQALHLLQQQQAQSQMQPTHQQNAAALYQYYQASFANMPQFVNATPQQMQQMSVGMMGASMVPSQPLIGNGPNANNGSSSGMTTPNSSVSAGPVYKPNNNNNQTHGGDNGNTGVNNVAPKKAIVSVQRAEQPNVPQQQQQQQQVAGTQQMVFPAQPIRYYPSEYMTQQGTQQPMHLQQIPLYYSMNTPGLIQASVGQHQNIMIPSAGSSAGQGTQAPHQLYYTGVYTDPRMYSIYQSAAAANQAGVNPNWQLARSPPQQQQQPTDQQRAYGNGQNVVPQQTSSTGAPISGGGSRSSSTSGPSGQTGAGNSSVPPTPQYTLNGSVPTAYAYGPPTAWLSGPQQVPSPQTNIPHQINAGYNIMFDPTQQQVQSQQPAYAHQNSYEQAAYFSPQSQQQQQQQPTPQQSLDAVPQGNYNR